MSCAIFSSAYVNPFNTALSRVIFSLTLPTLLISLLNIDITLSLDILGQFTKDISLAGILQLSSTLIVVSAGQLQPEPLMVE